MAQWIIDVVRTLDVAGIALLMILENVFPPLPSELIMPLAGYLAGRGDLGFAAVVTAGIIGSVIGASGWYFVARRLGRERLMRFADRSGRWLGFDRASLERAQHWFEYRSRRVVFFGRLIPGVRTLISLPAGFSDMPFGRFLLYTILGTTIWTAALAAAGLLLGRSFGDIGDVLGVASWIVVGIAVALYVRHIVRMRRATVADPPTRQDPRSARGA